MVRAKLNKMRLVAHVTPKLHDRLTEYVESKYHSKHGAISIVVEEALEQFLNREALAK